MNKIFLSYLLFGFSLLFLLQSCKKDTEIIAVKHGLSDVSKYDAKNAIDWFNLLRIIVATQDVNPPLASRVYAYAGITVYESVADGIKNNKPLHGQLNGFFLNAIEANTDSLDYDIIFNEALTLLAVCDTIIPSLTTTNRDSVFALHDRILQSKAGFVIDSIITKSRERGIVIATAIKKYAAADNYLSVKNLSYTVPLRDTLHPSYWEPTDGSHLNPVEPYWGKIRTFTLDSSSHFEIHPSVNFDTDTSSAFGRQANEVMMTVNQITPPQTMIVNWWRDASGTQTPAGHWIGIIQYVAHLKNYKLDKVAELYALVGITIADAFISCWDAKYKYNLLRPETYIRAYMNAGWNTGQGSTVITPTFPEYPSGHSVCSGAAAKVLTDALGSFAFDDSTNYYLVYGARTYANFYATADEAAISRLYGGIHYRDAIDNGIQQGKNIGAHVMSKVKFR